MLNKLPTKPRVALEGDCRIAIVASSYNAHLVEPMVESAKSEILTLKSKARILLVHAPGSYEIPYLANVVRERYKPDAIICLGVILRGETGHADLIAASVSNALCTLSVEKMLPVVHGVLLLENEEQAQERCLGEEHNRGAECARAALDALHAARSLATRNFATT